MTKLFTLQLHTAQDEREQEAAALAQTVESLDTKKSIAAHISTRWDAAMSARSEVTMRISDAVHIRKREYLPGKYQELKDTNQADIFVGLIDHKCNLATAWLRDLYFAQADMFWTFSPTPVPSIPEEFEPGVEELIQESLQSYTQQTGFEPDDSVKEQIREEVKKAVMEQVRDLATLKTKLQEKEISDILEESNYYDCINDMFYDLVTYPNCIMEFVLVKEKELTWGKDEFGDFIPVVKPKIKIKFERIDPNSLFPAKGSSGIHDRYVCILTRMDAEDIRALRGTPGTSDEDIDKLFDTFPEGNSELLGYYSTPERENEFVHPDPTYDIVKYFGKVSGEMLNEWEHKTNYDETEDYEVKAYYCSDLCLKVIVNQHPLNKRGLFSTSYKKISGQFWGESLVDLLKPMGDMCNAAARNLVGNMGIASGPQVEVNTDRIAPGETLTSMFPWKLWKTRSDLTGGSNPAIRFYQPDPIVTVLISVFQFFSDLADEFSGFPKFLVGSEQPTGAGRTATGLSMLMANASKFMKQVVLNVDRDLIRESLQYVHVHFMTYSTKDYAKGDINIVPKGVTHLTMQEAVTLRRNEFLQITNNPTDLQIMGLQGRMNLLKEIIPALDIDYTKVIPPEMEQRIEDMMRQQAMQGQQSQQQGQQPGQQQTGLSQETLQNGQPVADSFSPSSLV